MEQEIHNDKLHVTWHFNNRERGRYGPPGVILDAYESIAALALYFNHLYAINGLNSQHSWIIPNQLRVHHLLRSRILAAYLLYGKLDATAGMALFDHYLWSRGCTYGRREFFGDFYESPTNSRYPFSHDIESGSSYGYNGNPLSTIDDKRSILENIVRTLKYVGYEAIGLEYGQQLMRINQREIGMHLQEHIEIANSGAYSISTVNQLAVRILGAISHSSQRGIPFVSQFSAGPEWLAPELQAEKCELTKVIIDEVEWIPWPKNMTEAMSMAEDERILSLRHEVDLFFSQIQSGVVSDLQDIRRKIRNQSRQFRCKSWARTTSGLVTYLALPIGIVDFLFGSGIIGVGATVVGVAANGIADMVEHSKKRSWLSIGNDFLRK